MKVHHEDREIALFPRSYPVFFDNGFCIKLESKDGSDFIYIKLPPIFANVSKILMSLYSLRLYESNYWQEKSYSRLRYKKDADWRVVGYLFPLSTLCVFDSKFWGENSEGGQCSDAVETGGSDTTEQNFISDEIIRAHALAAILSLLHSEYGQNTIRSVSWRATYSLSDFYDDTLVLAVFSTLRINKVVALAEDVIDACAVNFAEYKTYPYGGRALKVKDPNLSFNILNSIDLRMQVEKKYFPLVRYLIDHLLPFEAVQCDPLVRFFLQYQFFELLMGEVFSGVMAEFMAKAGGEEFASNAWKTKDLVSKLNEKSGENYRISKIFGWMKGKYPADTEALNASCVELLTNCGKISELGDEEGKSPKIPYYLVRNLIFHGFGANNINRADIEKICGCVERLIYSVCLDFKNPSPYFGVSK